MLQLLLYVTRIASECHLMAMCSNPSLLTSSERSNDYEDKQRRSVVMVLQVESPTEISRSNSTSCSKLNQQTFEQLRTRQQPHAQYRLRG